MFVAFGLEMRAVNMDIPSLLRDSFHRDLVGLAGVIFIVLVEQPRELTKRTVCIQQ